MRILLSSIVVFAALSGGRPATAEGCVAALLASAERHGVPPALMLAVGRAESGWNAFAINAAGTAHYAASASEAAEFVRARQAEGIESIDVGCGQINLVWHADAFADLTDAFDPRRNADYAAAYLRRLKEAHGNWVTATGRYHSADPTRQSAYVERVRRHLALSGDGAAPSYFRVPDGFRREAGVTIVAPPNGAAAPGRVAPRIVQVGPVAEQLPGTVRVVTGR